VFSSIGDGEEEEDDDDIDVTSDSGPGDGVEWEEEVDPWVSSTFTVMEVDDADGDLAFGCDCDPEEGGAGGLEGLAAIGDEDASTESPGPLR